MNYVQWCDKVWQAVLDVYKSDPNTEYLGVTVDTVAQHIAGEGETIPGNAVQYAMEELKLHRVLEASNPVNWYKVTRSGLAFPEQRDTLHFISKKINVSPIGLQLLTAIADLTQDVNDTYARPTSITFEELQNAVGIIDSMDIDREMAELHRNNLIAGIRPLNANALWAAIEIRYAGLLRLNREDETTLTL